MTQSLKPGIDICICTFNRVGYLKQCVENLISQLNPDKIVLTIIDNHSTDGTKEYVRSLIEKNIQIRYFFEPKQGIGYARNRSWQESGHEWLFYIDDDCVPLHSILKEALECIEKHADMAAMGGPIFPVFSSPPPLWLPDGFGEFKMNYDVFSIIEKGYIRCGCFLVRRKILESLGGFKSYLGHKGYKLAYGEEIELQDRIRAAGYQVGYAPSLKMGHHVRVEKMNPSWILHSEYARRRDKMVFNPTGKTKATLNLLRTLASRVIWAPFHGWKALTKINYTWRNALLDTLIPVVYRWGEFVGSLKYRTTNPQSPEN